jgi:Domain of unknown function (DUF5916)/Carbohydrate family 9 binding domain-like
MSANSKLFFFSIYLIVLNVPVFAQQSINHIQSNYSITTNKTTDKIKVDGVLDEQAWQLVKPASNFWMKFPSNEEHAKLNTEVRITYDDKNIYFGVECFDPSGKYLVQSLKRDKGLRTGDGFAIILDPFNQKSNGFFFAVSAFNSQSDDLISGNDEVTFSWDNKWFSQTKLYGDKWVAEIAIPFNILRFDPSKTTWGINFLRSNRKQNQFFSWTNIPLQFRGTDIGYLGQLVWDTPPPKTGTNVSINPYVSGGLQADNQNGIKSNLTGNAGFDAKVAITNSLNLDVTVNPDFSQVDVDKQVTNLTRFSIFFPERRSFFLENDDLFSSYGIPPIRPFYTRRIGSSGDISVPILAGLRLSGNATKKLRIGLLNIQTGKKQNQPAANFTAATFKQRVFQRSSISGYFLNKQSSLSDAQKIANPLNAFGRNAGIELSFTDNKGFWSVFYGHHFSFKPNVSSKNQYVDAGFGYEGKNYNGFIVFDAVGTNFYTDMGFVQRISNYDAFRDTSIRRGFKSIYNANKFNHFFSKDSKLNRLVFELNNYFVYTFEGKFNEQNIENSIALDFKNSALISIGSSINDVQLLYPAKFLSNANASVLPALRYHYNRIFIKGSSDARKIFSVGGKIEVGNFYNGKSQEYGITFNVRKQPKFNMAIDVQYNKLKFPDPYGSGEFLLIAPNVEYNFSTNLFWTTFLQYNTQNNNLNINSRLQWRYKPMSDLFIVYTDNYFTDPFFKNKNRGLVFKLNYWLNL